MIKLPLGAATHLTYQLKFVGGEYSVAEETKYWRSRGDVVIERDQIFFRKKRDVLTVPAAAIYLDMSEAQIKRMIFDTRELHPYQRYPVLVISRRELNRWIDRNKICVNH